MKPKRDLSNFNITQASISRRYKKKVKKIRIMSMLNVLSILKKSDNRMLKNSIRLKKQVKRNRIDKRD